MSNDELIDASSPFKGEEIARSLSGIGNFEKQGDMLVFGDVTITQVQRDFLVTVPTPEGRAEFVYSEISRTPQAFNAVLSVHFNDNKEGLQPSFQQRINLNSASAVTDLRRSLDDAYGKKHRWAILLNKANTAIRTAFVESQKPVNVRDMEFTTDTFLLKPFLQKDVSNMVFGDSEVGKTYFCLRMAASLATGINFMGFSSPMRTKTLFLDYEDSLSTFNNRLFEISAGMGLQKENLADFIEWYKPDGSLRDIAEIVSRFVTGHNYGLIIIDAGSNAAGGSPNDEQKVVDMFNALEHIPCTKLIIHHEPKNVQGLADDKAYYGTTFWRALTRVAWRLTLENEEDGKLIKAVITKKSNLGKVEPIFYKQKWTLGGFETKYGPCYFDVVSPDRKKSGGDLITEALTEHGPCSRTQIMELTGLAGPYCKKLLLELKGKGTIACNSAGRNTVWYMPNGWGNNHSATVSDEF